jgi:signal transduction histidine kinase
MKLLRAVVADMLLPTMALLVGLAALIVFCMAVSGTEWSELRSVAAMLAGVGFASLSVGAAVIRLAPTLGLPGLRSRLVLTHLVIVLVAVANVAVTAGLMFSSPHDLGLLVLVLGFSAVSSISFGVTLSRQLLSGIEAVSEGARRVAAGELDARVEWESTDEVGGLARGFNHMAARVASATRQREEAEMARRELIASVSHDLRTPLASVRAMVEAINDRVVTDHETVDRYLRSVQIEIGQLSRLIDDLFELSRLDAGALTLQLEEGSVRDLLSDTVEAFQPEASRKGVRLTGEADSSLPTVPMDAARVQQVLSNLVQNAIRHTPARGHVMLQACECPDGIRVDVVDSGEGVTPQDVPHVFERFYRGDRARGRNGGGAGLGLAIAKGLVEAHGGEIWVESRPGMGARFSFVLPLPGREPSRSSGVGLARSN